MRLPVYPVTVVVLVLLLCTVSCKNKASKNPVVDKKAVAASATLLDSATLIHDLAALTTDAMAGRETGTPGNQLAREYIAKRYDSLQLKAPDSGRFQPFPLKQNAAVKGTNI